MRRDQGLRLRVDGVQGSLSIARAVEATLWTIPGVRSVWSDVAGGSTVVVFEPRARGADVVVLPPVTALAVPIRRRWPRGPTLLGKMMETVVIVGAELLLQRAFGPLFRLRGC